MSRRRRPRRLAGWRTKGSEALTVAAVAGLGLLVLQRIAAQQHYSRAPALGGPKLGISILKPLTGKDAGLGESLEAFARMPYGGPFEMLLGVENTQDPAYPLAKRLAQTYPHVKVIVTGQGTHPRGAVSLNPKVRQLEAMEPYAAHDVLLISDANMRPPLGYLDEISTLVSQGASLVTSAYAGAAGGSLGSQLDGLQNVTNAGHQLAGAALGVPLAMGGSEAITRGALARLGGFARYRGVLAEDYLMGRDVAAMGEKVAITRRPVTSYTPARDVSGFAARVSRWTTMQATATGDATPAALAGLLNPIPLALGALALAPSATAAKALGLVALGKIALDASHAAALGAPINPALIPFKDCVQFGAWAKGLVNREVDWRGNKLRVGDETRLSKP